MIRGIIILYLIFLSLNMAAQSNTVQVATRTIEKQYLFKKPGKIKITGERANINIIGWDKPEIIITAKLISKAPSRKIAVKELAYQDLLTGYIGKELNVRNSITMPATADKLEALHSATIEVKMPHHMIVTVVSNYKDISIKNISGEIHLDHKYGNLQLENISARADYKMYFGKVYASESEGSSLFNLQYTPVQITKSGGSIKINTLLGDVSILQPTDLESLTINGEKSNIEIKDFGFQVYFIRAKCKYGELQLGSNVIDVQNGKWEHGDQSKKLMSLSTKFGNITIVP